MKFPFVYSSASHSKVQVHFRICDDCNTTLLAEAEEEPGQALKIRTRLQTHYMAKNHEIAL